MDRGKAAGVAALRDQASGAWACFLDTVNTHFVLKLLHWGFCFTWAYPDSHIPYFDLSGAKLEARRAASDCNRGSTEITTTGRLLVNDLRTDCGWLSLETPQMLGQTLGLLDVVF